MITADQHAEKTRQHLESLANERDRIARGKCKVELQRKTETINRPTSPCAQNPLCDNALFKDVMSFFALSMAEAT